ncbi:MAG: translation initiation factor IF-1 [Pedosphaera sp.]|nr:translation initiation factor IF-1 [Pedosphaera sp.]
MPGEAAIETEGRVIEVLSNKVFRVELSNGHRLLAHVSGRMRLSFVKITLGDLVTVEMSPYDLSTGRIADKET